MIATLRTWRYRIHARRVEDRLEHAAWFARLPRWEP